MDNRPSVEIMDKTSGLYKIAAKIIKKVKAGSNYKSELYQSHYPNKLLLNAVLMNVFKWENVIDKLIEKSNILEKENNMDRDLLYVFITEMMFSKFGLKGNAKNILAIKSYKDEFLQLMEDYNLKSKPMKVLKIRYFRVNTLVISLEEMLKRLSELKFNKLKTPKTYVQFLDLIKSDKLENNSFVQDFHIKELLVFNSKVKFYTLEEYHNGSLIIQDKASCLAAHLLNPEPKSIVLDMCAAPGMKTSHLAAIMKNTGKLYAIDRSTERFNTMEKLLAKAGVKNVETFNMDALKFTCDDDVKYILIDPSCSGSGIIGRARNDSSGQNQNVQMRLNKLANVHAQLLNHALQTYPNLKRLVYSTCSLNAEENEAVVDEALYVNGKFKLLDCSKMIKGWTNKGCPGYDCSKMCLNAIPSIDCTNGFFIAIFVRRDSEEIENNIIKVEENESNDEGTVDEKVFVKTEGNTRKNKANSKSSAVELKLENNIVKVEKNESNGEETVDEKVFVKTKKNTRGNKANSKLSAVELKLENNIVKVEKNESNDEETVDEKVFVKTKKNTRENKANSKLSAVESKLENNIVKVEENESNNEVTVNEKVFVKTKKNTRENKANSKLSAVKPKLSKNQKRRARRLKLEQNYVKKIKTEEETQ